MNERTRSARRPLLAQGLALTGILGLAMVFPELLKLSQWKPPQLVALLAGFAIVSYLFLSVEAKSGRYHAGYVAVIFAAAFLGPVPAIFIGVGNELIAWLIERYRIMALLNNMAAYGWAGAIAGLCFSWLGGELGVSLMSPAFYFAILPITLLALAPIYLFTFFVVHVIGDGETLRESGTGAFIRTLPSQFLTACFIALIAFLYIQFGLAAMATFIVVAVANQFLVQRLLQARERSEKLASLNAGIMASLVRGLHLRDSNTARHSAAVARYAREMAAELGWSEERQELVHTAALLHDIGKFALPDHILKGGLRLSVHDWKLVREHPRTGADLLRSVSGYGPVADIVLAHHERPDGQGYPQGLRSGDIPEASRLIAVADAYDVITARSKYNSGKSSFEALRELRRCEGTQFDQRFVDSLARVLMGRSLEFRHGDDADFDSEVGLGDEALKIALG